MTRGSECREPVDQKDIQDDSDHKDSSDGAVVKQADGFEMEKLKGNTNDFSNIKMKIGKGIFFK